MASLRKNLRDDPRLSAFSDAFDPDLLNRKIEEAEKSNVNQDDVSAAISGFYFNKVYKEFYHKLKGIIKKEILTIGEIEELIISNCNRVYLCIRNEANKKAYEQMRANGGDFLSTTYQNIKVKGATGEVSAVDGLENHIRVAML